MRNVDGETMVVPLVFRNVRTKPLTFVLEPWGDEYTVPPESEIRVEFIGPPGHSPLVEWSDDCVTVYGWSGSTARLFRDGREIGSVSNAQQPLVPESAT